MAKPAATIFYSWQSDLPNKTNRGFIQAALERAIHAIVSDESVVLDVVLDRDTQNVSGAPDIAVTIFKKIDSAAVFVADVSIVLGEDSGRPSPNPNVLIELGYALRALGDERVILVMNTAFGKPEMLPFDLRRKRITPYKLPESSDDKARERDNLANTLQAGLRLILSKVDASPPPPDRITEAASAIKAARPDQGPAALDVMNSLTDEIEVLQPVPQQQVFADDVLIETLPKTIPIVTEFARLVDVAARYDSQQAVLAIAQGLQPVLDGYHAIMRGNLSIVEDERGLSQFLGHELLVIATVILMRHGRWKRLGEFLATKHLVDTNYGRQVFGFPAFSAYIEAPGLRKQRLKLNRTLLHADILQTRHSSGDLAAMVPFSEFIDADILLFLASELPPAVSPVQGGSLPFWRPWSVIYLERFSSPRFLDEMQDENFAGAVAQAMGIESVETFRERYADRAVSGLRAVFRNSVPFFEPRFPAPEKIGSRR